MSDDSEAIGRRMARLLGIDFRRYREVTWPDRKRLMKGLVSRSKYLKRIAKKLGRPVPSSDALRFVFSKSTRAYRQSWRIARQLKEKSYIVGVISNTVPPHRFMPKPPVPYSKVFWPIVFSYRVHARKPERRIFEIARRRTGVRFTEIAFLDDKIENVRAAQQLGIKAFVYKNPVQLVRSLRRLGVRI